MNNKLALQYKLKYSNTHLDFKAKGTLGIYCNLEQNEFASSDSLARAPLNVE